MARNPASRIYRPYGLTGSLSKRIEEGMAKGKFTLGEQAIAVAMSDDWHQTAWAPATRLAESARCDKAAISRFVRRLGYANHSELQRAAQAEINSQEYPEDRHRDVTEEDKSGWLMHEIARLERDTKAFILKSKYHELEETADQIEFTASRLSRADRIIIAAATTGAIPLMPIVQELFGSGMMTVVKEATTTEKLAAKVGNFLVILHAGSSSSSLETVAQDRGLFDWTQAATDRVHAVHLVIDGANPQGTYDHRILRLHDGSDRLAGISMLISTCIVLIREATRRDSSKAR